MTLAVVLALVAAALFAVASVAQQRGTAGVSDDEALGAGMVAALARRPVWLLGMGADVAGFAVQAAALAVGSLLLVQPLLVTTLVFALPMAAWVDHRRLSAPEWTWATVLALSLTVFLLLGEPTAGRDDAPLSDWIPVAIVVGPLVAGCVAAGSALPHGTRRSLALAVAAGLLLGVAGPLTKTAVAGFDGGFVSGVTNWELWAMAVCASLGTFWQQSSYQAGDVQTSLPAVTVLKPVVAMALGLTLYEETLAVGDAGDALLVGSLVAMAGATVALGRLAAPPATPA